MGALAGAASLGDVALLRIAGAAVALGAVAFGVALARAVGHLVRAHRSVPVVRQAA